MPVALEMPPQWLGTLATAVRSEIEDQDCWVALEGLAGRLGCDAAHVYALRKRGLPGHKLPDKHGRLSKKLYFRLAEVWDWFERESVIA